MLANKYTKETIEWFTYRISHICWLKHKLAYVISFTRSVQVDAMNTQVCCIMHTLMYQWCLHNDYRIHIEGFANTVSQWYLQWSTWLGNCILPKYQIHNTVKYIIPTCLKPLKNWLPLLTAYWYQSCDYEKLHMDMYCTSIEAEPLR